MATKINTLAEKVRNHCNKTYIIPARNQRNYSATIRSGDVHSALNFKQRYPLVCVSIGSRLFENQCNLKRISIDGPMNGANTYFTFLILDNVKSD